MKILTVNNKFKEVDNEKFDVVRYLGMLHWLKDKAIELEKKEDELLRKAYYFLTIIGKTNGLSYEDTSKGKLIRTLERNKKYKKAYYDISKKLDNLVLEVQAITGFFLKKDNLKNEIIILLNEARIGQINIPKSTIIGELFRSKYVAWVEQRPKRAKKRKSIVIEEKEITAEKKNKVIEFNTEVEEECYTGQWFSPWSNEQYNMLRDLRTVLKNVKTKN